MNESKPINIQTPHEISLKDRRRMSISGVCEVMSFDESGIRLRTVSGELAIEGAGLHIGVLDTERGVVTLEGDSIDGMWYLREESGKKKGIFGKWHA
ncbi:MAG: sporulation protein YabP [Clostridia bacterium]|jgi:sporulation protein YabP|nr:sporulation protein YabP [Clostridia bacterium]